MTFKEEDIRGISLDPTDEWICDEDTQDVSVMINGLEAYATRFFDVNLEEQYADGYVDTYAVVDPQALLVKGVCFVLKTNENGPDDNRELDIKFTNIPEGKMFFEALVKAGEGLGLNFKEEMRKTVFP